MKPAFVIALIAGAITARAELIVYEPFDYPEGSSFPERGYYDATQAARTVADGGTGQVALNLVSQGHSPLKITAESLSYTDPNGTRLETKGRAAGLPEKDSHIFAISEAAIEKFSALQSPTGKGISSANGEFWISFLMKLAGPINPEEWVVLKLSGKDTNLPVGYINSNSPVVTLVSQSTKVPIEPDEVYLVVLRCSGKDGGTVSVWVNPPVGGSLEGVPPNAIGRNLITNLETYWFQNRGPEGRATFDEIRIGETSEDVVPAAK